MAGIFIIILDFFIVNVALPSIQADLQASASGIEWVVAGYGLTFATFLIVSGRIGDRIGRRRTYTMGIALFTLASAACGAAPRMDVLIGARLIQGVAAALIHPNVLAIVGVVFRGPQRSRALTAYGLVAGFAAVSAQLIGGLLIHLDVADLGWRSVFLINVPIGVVVVLLAGRVVPESRADGATRLDLAGTALGSAAPAGADWRLWLQILGIGGLSIRFVLRFGRGRHADRDPAANQEQRPRRRDQNLVQRVAAV
jgi:MFS family permease